MNAKRLFFAAVLTFVAALTVPIVKAESFEDAAGGALSKKGAFAAGVSAQKQLAVGATAALRGKDHGHARRSYLICESRGYKYASCDAGMWIMAVRLRSQISKKSPCIEGRTWGYDDRRIWVNQGCRAGFDVYGR